MISQRIGSSVANPFTHATGELSITDTAVFLPSLREVSAGPRSTSTTAVQANIRGFHTTGFPDVQARSTSMLWFCIGQSGRIKDNKHQLTCPLQCRLNCSGGKLSACKSYRHGHSQAFPRREALRFSQGVRGGRPM